MAVESAQPAATAPEGFPEPELYVVGIGASAGGLAALQKLLDCIPANPGFACVIVMHLSPEHESHLPELLQQHTRMPVQQVTATVAIERDRVYVIPPNANLTTIDTHLRLTQLEARRIERAPIDHFLRTLAATHDGTAIGVILTGAGSDGSIGLRHIKECGGLTIAQEPREAEYDSMPRSAIATGMVDLILPLQRICDEILRFCATRPSIPIPDGDDEIESHEDVFLGRILSELRRRTEHDFGLYKRATLFKRLRRRMQLHHITTLGAYLEVLTQQRQEAHALSNDLLLVPTEFFRDAEIFLELEQRVIPQVFNRQAAADGRIRAWSIGCSTGEEAYSLAILLREECTKQACALPLQVFATAFAENGLRMARQAVYPREIAAMVSAERLDRFFTSHVGFFRVKQELREMVLFAPHDIFKDPPFAHIDIIVCRNFLSELQPEVRQGVLNLFHYALEPNGMLVVGAHEEVIAPELFMPEGGSTRLLRRVGGATRPPALPTSMQPFGRGGIRRAQVALPAAAQDIAVLYRSAIESYVPPSALINAENSVLHFSPNSPKYLHIPGGVLTHDLTRLVREPLRSLLLEGLRIVRTGSRFWNSAPLSMHTGDGWSDVVLRLESLARTELVLVVFDDRSASEARPCALAARNTVGLETELRQLDRRLQEMGEPARESAQIAAADTQIGQAAAELQSVLDELASSRQELQAVKEEVIALDRENHRRVQELTQVSADLQHLLAATGIATLLLDPALRIVRFTPLLGTLFGLRPADIGRSLSDLARLTRNPELEADARRVLERLEPIDREMMGPDGDWYINRMLPYRSEEGRIEGVAVTLIDITERRRAEEALREASRHKDQFLAVLAHELRNPLAPISSGVEVLKAAPNDSRLVERIAATMGRQTRQLVRLVDDLLEVSRISGGKLRLHVSTIDLKEVIQDAVASVKPAIERADHALDLHVSAQPMWVNGDAARLTQVLSNLLSNAVRYTPAPGTISMTAAQEGGHASIVVSDSGVGIPRESLGRVFDMFYQGRGASPGLGAGLGIGLTLAKTLVEMHGGIISVASGGENKGSEFTVLLPLTQPATAPGKLVASETDPTLNADHRILIVDDNVDAAETLCMLIKSLGEREVHTVSSGEQALKTAPELHPDIVLLDLMMPAMDGYEVARRMRSQPWGKDVLLIALSGWGHEEYRRRSKEAGFDHHVTKPADLSALKAVLGERRASNLDQPH